MLLFLVFFLNVSDSVDVPNQLQSFWMEVGNCDWEEN